MKTKMTNMQKTGLFAIIIIVASYLLINFLKRQDIFNKNNTYYAEYENINGLTPTVPVDFKGFVIGAVESITYNTSNGKFLVTFKIKSQYPIPSNSVASIYSEGIMSTTRVKIVPGDSPTLISNRDTLIPNIEADMIAMLITEVLPLKDSISTLISSLNTTITGINQIIDIEGQTNIKKILRDLSVTVKNLEQLSATLNNSSPEITATLGNLKNLTSKLDNAAGPLSDTMENLSKISDSLAAADIASTITSIRLLLDDVRDPKGSVGKLISTDSLHTSINALIENLDELIESIKQNPKKYFKITVF